MHKAHLIWLVPLALLLLLFATSAERGISQSTINLAACKDFAYSTEEDFLTQGPVPADGMVIISDGDLLSRSGVVCMRNRDLLRPWDLNIDLGLDAVDILDIESELVAFSTELNHPTRKFTAGDLLITNGAVIPNQALLLRFQITGDRGLDAVHFVGELKNIRAFLDFARQLSRDDWLRDPSRLATELQRHHIDIWFSIEGTEQRATTFSVYDGDLLSAAYGVVVMTNGQLLPAGVPAGLPQRGVDFGLDAFSAERGAAGPEVVPHNGRFSTEILHRGELAFSDGDILKIGNGIALADKDLYAPFEPKADFLGTDALFLRFETQPPGEEGYLPLILRLFRGVAP